MIKIITNKIQCRHCGDIIESTYTHDWKKCSCGKVSVDGGHEYMRRSYYKEDDYIELSESREYTQQELDEIEERKRQRKEENEKLFYEIMTILDQRKQKEAE